jgi:hypothetical protein
MVAGESARMTDRVKRDASAAEPRRIRHGMRRLSYLVFACYNRLFRSSAKRNFPSLLAPAGQSTHEAPIQYQGSRAIVPGISDQRQRSEVHLEGPPQASEADGWQRAPDK